MTPENWINIAGITIGALLTIGVTVASGVGGLLIWFVQKFFTATHSNLSAIREEVTKTNLELAKAVTRSEADRTRLDDHAERLDEHADRLNAHGADIGLLKSKVP